MQAQAQAAQADGYDSYRKLGLILAVLLTIIGAAICKVPDSDKYGLALAVFTSAILLVVHWRFKDDSMGSALTVMATAFLLFLSGPFIQAGELSTGRTRSGFVLMVLGMWLAFVCRVPLDLLESLQNRLSPNDPNRPVFLAGYLALAVNFLGCILLWAASDDEKIRYVQGINPSITALLLSIIFVFSFFRLNPHATFINIFFGAYFGVSLLANEVVEGEAADGLISGGHIILFIAQVLFIGLLLFSMEGSSADGVVAQLNSAAKAFSVRFIGIVICIAAVIVGAILVDGSDISSWLFAWSVIAVFFLLVASAQSSTRQLGFALVAAGIMVLTSPNFVENANDYRISKDSPFASDDFDYDKMIAGFALGVAGMWAGFLFYGLCVEKAKGVWGAMFTGRLNMLASVGAAFSLLGLILIWIFLDKNDISSDLSLSITFLLGLLLFVVAFFFDFNSVGVAVAALLLACLAHYNALQRAITLGDDESGYQSKDTGVAGIVLNYIAFFVFFAPLLVLKLATVGDAPKQQAAAGAPAAHQQNQVQVQPQPAPAPAPAPAGDAARPQAFAPSAPSAPPAEAAPAYSAPEEDPSAAYPDIEKQ